MRKWDHSKNVPKNAAKATLRCIGETEELLDMARTVNKKARDYCIKFTPRSLTLRDSA